MKDLKFLRRAVGILLLSPLMLASCSDLDSYYETPEWIGGSIYQTLKDEGNYGIFLQGVDIAGYQAIMDGKSILTVMAPDDAAMTTYLQQTYGTSDITQVSKDEVKKLIGFHILYNAFDKNKLMNFRPNEGDGATDEELALNAGLYYKFRTRSQDANTTAFDKTRNRDVTVYHNERMLPVFSHRMFTTKNIDAKAAYEYFYPETGWQGDGGFNVANAAVTEYEKIGRNGYIYKIDRVIKPLETIYKELKKSGKYSRFLKVFDAGEYFAYDEIAHRELQYPDSLFHLYHTLQVGNNSYVMNIDSEWGDVLNYQMVDALASYSYSIFAPTDEAFDRFFNEYWGPGGYSSLDEVEQDNITQIIQNCISMEASLLFPGDIAKGKTESILGEIIEQNFDSIPQEDRLMCSNGVLYGCNVITPPAKFRAVSGPLYQYKDFRYFRDMVESSGMTGTITTDAVSFIMLFPDTTQMANAAGFKMIKVKPEDLTETLVSTSSPNGVSSSAKTAWTNAHIVTPVDGNSVLPETGVHVYPTMTTDFKLYWYLKDGKITNSILNNYRLKFAANTVDDSQIWASVEPLAYCGDVDGWTNGHAYRYSNTDDPTTNSIFFPGNYDQVSLAGFEKMVRLMINNRQDPTTEFFGWINLMNKARLLNTSGGTVNFMLDNCLMLIPTTEVVEQAIIDGKIPGVSATEAAVVGDAAFFDNVTIDDAVAFENYARLYYVPLSTATFNNYPYVGWGEDTRTGAGLQTYDQEVTFNVETMMTEIVSSNMNVWEEGGALYATVNNRHQEYKDSEPIKISAAYDGLPFVFQDGCAHFVEGVFEFK